MQYTLVWKPYCSLLTLSGRTLTDGHGKELRIKGKTIAQALYAYQYTKGFFLSELETFQQKN